MTKGKLDSIRALMCDDYCKWPVDNSVTQEQMYNICNTCPLGELEEGPKWIPVTERLPDENVRVLVTRKSNIFVRDDYIDIGRYTKQKRWETEEYVNVDVKAWMPLPEPYKGGDAD